MGFCGGIVDGEPRHVSDYFPATGDVTADEFAYWVYQAEGWRDVTPELAPILDFGSDFRAAFIHFMGGDRVPASDLKWP
jgi:hypothetical protein